MKKFKKNIELDTRMVLAGIKGGIDGVMQFGLINRHEFKTTKDVIDRTDWLKKQSDDYINQIVNKISELE